MAYGKSDEPHFESFFELWDSIAEYVKKRKQKVHADHDGREYVLSDAGNAVQCFQAGPVLWAFEPFDLGPTRIKRWCDHVAPAHRSASSYFFTLTARTS